MAKTTNEDRLRQAPVASGRMFNEAAEVVNIADLVSALVAGATVTIGGLGFVGDAAKLNIAGSGPATAPHIVHTTNVTEAIVTAQVPSGFSITYATVIARVNEAWALTATVAEFQRVANAFAAILFDADSGSFANSALGTGVALPESLVDGQQFYTIPLNVPTAIPFTAAMVNGTNSTGRVDMRSSSLDVPIDITIILS